MRILYVQPGPGMGGSKISLYHMLRCAPATQRSYLALSAPVQKEYENLVKDHVEKIFYLELPTWQKFQRRTWQEKIRAPLGDAVRLAKLLPAIQKLKEIIQSEGIDLVHTNNSVGAAGAIAAKFAKKPHIWHVREPIGSKRQYRPILGERITFWLMNKLSRMIICNSSYTAEVFYKRNIPNVIIQNGLDSETFFQARTSGQSQRTILGVLEDDLVIGMVGNLSTEWKRHDIFLEMAGSLSKESHKTKFIIFGSNTNLDQTEYTRKLSGQANRLGINDRVIWADFTSENAAMMNCLDILVHPALTEGSGRVVMEAMAAGKPVVAMKSGGVQELIRDRETGVLVQPGNINELAATVKLLLENESLRREIGENARNYAQAHFSEQASMDAIVKIYQDVVAKV